MIDPSILRALVAAGATAEQLLAAIEADFEAEQARKARQIPWPQLRVMALARDGEVCGYCSSTDGPFEVDHVIPRAAGGEDVMENVKVACRSCNRAKKDRGEDEWSALHERRERDKLRKRAERALVSKPVRGQRRTVKDSPATPPPNDIYSNPPPKPSEAKASEPPFAEIVVSAWNDGPARRGATKAQKMDAGRRKLLATRVREHGQDGVLAAIRGIELSDFHCGIGEKSFRSTLGWLLKSPEPFAAAIDRAASAAPTAAAKPVADTGAYLAGIADKPWMRGRENELAQPRSAGPPRSIGQLAAGIAGIH